MLRNTEDIPYEASQKYSMPPKAEIYKCVDENSVLLETLSNIEIRARGEVHKNEDLTKDIALQLNSQAAILHPIDVKYTEYTL